MLYYVHIVFALMHNHPCAAFGLLVLVFEHSWWSKIDALLYYMYMCISTLSCMCLDFRGNSPVPWFQCAVSSALVFPDKPLTNLDDISYIAKLISGSL